MKARSKGMTVLLMSAAAAVSILLPAQTLFTGDGFLAPYIRTPESGRMLTEISVWFFLLLAVWLILRDAKKRMLASAALAAAFCWLHVVFLPMAVSALYMGFLLLLGRFLHRVLLRTEKEGASQWPVHFILGSCCVITVYCLLSAAGMGRISLLRFLCAAAGAFLYGGFLKEQTEHLRKGKGMQIEESMPLFGRLSAVYILMMLLIQVGRMNIALDFDTLWYGVRSEYILAGGKGMYENPGLVGMAYIYSKGFEILTLPLCDLASHSYLLFFNVWLAVMGLGLMYRITRGFAGRRTALLASVCTASLPGIMNMAVSAKPDMITWLLQLIMIERFFCCVCEDGQRRRGFFETAGAYLLSLAMKPTSLVFSTALFGMMGIYLLASRRLSLRAPASHWMTLVFPAAALSGVWARTLCIAGMPVMSVFTSVFTKLGFKLKYPFASGALPQNWQEEDNLHVLGRRLYQMLLAPEGEDMGHVIIAWGSPLLFFLLVCLLLFYFGGDKKKRKRTAVGTAFQVIAWPFLAVNLISLVMLYQVDGNYFMLLYSILILAFCMAAADLRKEGIKIGFNLCLCALLAFNALITAETNWAWSVGFSEIRLVNKGRVNHRARQQERLSGEGNAAIWQHLCANPQNRVIAFGNHPFCLEFPCNVQSYKDITAPWGNVELVDSPEAFEGYMEYARTDYIYAEAGYIGRGSWEWSYDLLRALIARGTLTDLFFEEGNMLARVGEERLSKKEALENLAAFDANYRTAQPAASVEQEEDLK